MSNKKGIGPGDGRGTVRFDTLLTDDDLPTRTPTIPQPPDDGAVDGGGGAPVTPTPPVDPPPPVVDPADWTYSGIVFTEAQAAAAVDTLNTLTEAEYQSVLGMGPGPAARVKAMGTLESLSVFEA